VSLLDIHAGLSFAAIAPLIGMEPIASYPVSAKCPYCEAQAWAIYQDTKTLEEWYYCSQCKATGTILAMAAARLNMLQEEAMYYLAEQLNRTISPSNMRLYLRGLGFSAKLQELWKQSQLSMKNEGREHYQALLRLGWNISSPMSKERHQAGPGQLLGILTPTQVAKYGRFRLLKKKDPTVVVPYYRSPTQIGALACFNNGTETIVNSNVGGEVGFAGLPYLWQIQSDSLVLTSMLTNMVRLQLRNFNSSEIPLPILAWRQFMITERKKQWPMLGGRQLIFWECHPTAAILHQAMLSNASMTFTGPEIVRQQPKEVSGPRWNRWMSDMPVTEVYQQIVRTAKPYERALSNWALYATPADKTKLLQDAEQHSSEVAKLVRSYVAPNLLTEVGRRIRVPINQKLPTVGGTTYMVMVEKNNKWYDDAGNVRFSGIVRVDKIVIRPDASKEYVGYLQTNEGKYPFRVPVEKANLAWITEFGLSHGIVLQSDCFCNIWGNRWLEKFNPFTAACQIELPEVVNGLQSIGWDGSGFQFRNSRLCRGEFSSNPEFTFPEDAPGPKQLLCRLRDDVILAISDESPELEIIWAFAMAMCAQVTAPAVGFPAYGIWVDHPTCSLFLQELYHRFEIRCGQPRGWVHKWPRRIQRFVTALTQDDTGFFVTSFAASQCKSDTSNLIKVTNIPEGLQPRKVTHSCDKIVLQYLKHFSKSDHETPASWEAWKDYTVTQMQQLFGFIRSKALDNAPSHLHIT